MVYEIHYQENGQEKIIIVSRRTLHRVEQKLLCDGMKNVWSRIAPMEISGNVNK